MEAFSTTQHPIIISINIQSIQSKHLQLQQLLDELAQEQVPVHIVALQETWYVPYPELLNIKGYKFLNINRNSGRGGGVGFYVSAELNAEIVHSICIPKVFECLTIAVTINGHKYVVSSVYRSPSPPPPLSLGEQIETFIQNLEETMLRTSNNSNTTTVICLDSNINAHNAHANHQSMEYFQTILNSGYVQCISQSTRIQGTASTLIDHIITNATAQCITSGTIISDISDHFITFVVLTKQIKSKTDTKCQRNMSAANIERFRVKLGESDWGGGGTG